MDQITPTTPKPMTFEEFEMSSDHVLDGHNYRKTLDAYSYNSALYSCQKFYEERLKEKDEEISLHSSLAAGAEIKYFKLQAELDKANEKLKVYEVYH